MLIHHTNHYKMYRASNVNSTRLIDVSIYIYIHLCPLQPDGQTDGQNIYRIYKGNLHKKESELYLKYKPRKSCFCILHLCFLQPEGQIIHRIDAYPPDESSQKESELYIKQQTRKSCFIFLHFCHLQPDRKTKYLQNRCSQIMGIFTKKIGPLS